MYSVTKIFIFILLCSVCGFGHEITGHVVHYPDGGRITLGILRGHITHFVDSTCTDASGKFRFQLPANAISGFYRLVFIDDRYVEIIVNSESIECLIDFECDPLTDSLQIVRSYETKVYYNILEIEAHSSVRLVQLSQLLRLYQEKSLHPSFQTDLLEEISRLDQARRQKLAERVAGKPDSFISHWLNACYAPLPQFSSEWRVNYANERAFLLDHYLDHVHFFDEKLLSSSYFPMKLEYYLRTIVPKDIKSQKYGIDLILQKSKISSRIHDYIVNFLYHHYTISDQKLLAEYVHSHNPASE